MHVLSFKRVILNYRERKSFLTVGGVRITGSENSIPFVLTASKLEMNGENLGSVSIFVIE